MISEPSCLKARDPNMLGSWHGASRRKHRKLIQSHMIAKLFRRLTADRGAGAALFDWATAAARQRDWYVEGSVPDTIDGRFAVLCTVIALCCLRLEQLGREGDALSVALTERFADVMESEHRELGIGDPTLGKTVLKLVGALGRRVDAMRPAAVGTGPWVTAARAAFSGISDEQAIAWLAIRLELVAGQLRSAGADELARGQIR
jgi:cytochrome b pre-mRNA-processing protein 3